MVPLKEGTPVPSFVFPSVECFGTVGAAFPYTSPGNQSENQNEEIKMRGR